MRLRINPDKPQEKPLQQAVDCLQRGGVIIYPTDSFYALGCDIQNKKAVERLCRIKGLDIKKALVSCLCGDMKHVGEYANKLTTPIYKIMKRAIPGPYTFILQASRNVPKHFQTRKTVGVRVPDHAVPLALIQRLGNPIASLSVEQDEEDPDLGRDPELIWERYRDSVDLVLAGGYGNFLPSTIIDCSQGENAIEVIREGMGPLDVLGL